MHPTSRQLLSWEWYCYPILLIHFESLDAYLLPHRRFLKVLPTPDITESSVTWQSVSSRVYKCLSWHSRKAELVSDVVASQSSEGRMSPLSLWFVKSWVFYPGHCPAAHSDSVSKVYSAWKALRIKKRIFFKSFPDTCSNTINGSLPIGKRILFAM